jgi:hypothetical protein
LNLFVSFQSHRLLHRVLDQYEPVLGSDLTRDR